MKRLPVHGKMASRWDVGEIVGILLIDDEDLSLVAGKKVTLHNEYPSVWVGGTRHYIHHLVLGEPPDGLEVDHKNRKKLDARRSNLRFVTRQQNAENTSGWRQSSSIHRGVSWSATRGKWEAYVCPSGRKISLGYFEREVDAARAALAGRLHYMPNAA